MAIAKQAIGFGMQAVNVDALGDQRKQGLSKADLRRIGKIQHPGLYQ